MSDSCTTHGLYSNASGQRRVPNGRHETSACPADHSDDNESEWLKVRRTRWAQLIIATAELTRLTTTGGEGSAWSPDGMEIAYTNARLGRIWIMNADGSNKHPLFEE